jgi:hypothetical protein
MKSPLRGPPSRRRKAHAKGASSLFEVEKILGYKKLKLSDRARLRKLCRKDPGEYEFLVEWKGYPNPMHFSWLNASDMEGGAEAALASLLSSSSTTLTSHPVGTMQLPELAQPQQPLRQQSQAVRVELESEKDSRLERKPTNNVQLQALVPASSSATAILSRAVSRAPTLVVRQLSAVPSLQPARFSSRIPAVRALTASTSRAHHGMGAQLRASPNPPDAAAAPAPAARATVALRTRAASQRTWSNGSTASSTSV